jgi:rhamnosyltransferase
MTQLTNRLPKAEVTNTAAVVVSYYPDKDFGERLTKLKSQFAAVYWIDNTPGAEVGSKHLGDPDVNYISQGVNAGLGAALNMGCTAALKDGFEWVVTFDQDSDFVADFLCQQIVAWQECDSSTFILGCNYSVGDNAGIPRFKAGDYVAVCKTVITSGCLMCLPAWDDLGRFRDDYFIDGIDHEICLRGRSKGLVVGRHGRVLMKHRIGERSANYRVFPYLHTPVRKYYSMRNGIRNILRYAPSEPVWAIRKSATLAWEVVIALLLEPDRRKKMRAMFRGLRDGLMGRMGAAPDDLAS